jgi:hypothetical protein
MIGHATGHHVGGLPLMRLDKGNGSIPKPRKGARHQKSRRKRS